MTNISLMNTQRLPEMNQPKWFETEKAAKIAAIAIGVFSVIAIGASIAMIASGIPPLVITGVILLATSPVSLIASGCLFKKQCWNDPAFVKKERVKADQMDYLKVVNTYKHRVNKLYSKEDLTQKVIKEIDAGTLSYSDVRGRNYFDPPTLKPYFKKEVEDIDIFDFFRWEIQVGIITKDDPWYKERLNNWGNSADFYSLERAYDRSEITRDELKGFLTHQLNEKGFSIIDKSNIKKIFNNDFISREVATPIAKAAVANMTIKEIVDKYSWDIFLTGILDATEYKEQFEQEANPLSFKLILEKYGKNVLESKITSRAFLEARLGSLSFEQAVQQLNQPVYKGSFQDQWGK